MEILLITFLSIIIYAQNLRRMKKDTYLIDCVIRSILIIESFESFTTVRIARNTKRCETIYAFSLFVINNISNFNIHPVKYVRIFDSFIRSFFHFDRTTPSILKFCPSLSFKPINSNYPYSRFD